jgi:hypothetical protein
MKTGISLFMCFLLITGWLVAQNPTRTVLYKLSNTEELHAGEYSLSLTGNAYRIAYVVGDNQNNRYRFLINNKIIGEFEEMLTSFSSSRINMVNLEEENGYVFSYSKNNQWYINDKAVVYGPFQRFQFLYSETDPSAFAYQKEGQWYQNEGGKVTGPYTGGTPLANFGVQNKRGDYIFYTYDEAGNNFFNFNHKMMGPYEEANSMPHLNDRGDYAIEYKKNGQWYALVNGKEFGPYLFINGITINASGDFMVVSYDDQLKSSVLNINGKVSPFKGNIDEFIFKSPDKFAVSYTDDQKLKWVQYKEQISGPFNRVHSLTMSDQGKLSYVYNSDKMNYLRNGADLYGPYKYVYIDIYDSEKDELTFVYGNQFGHDVVMHRGSMISGEEYEELREIKFGGYLSKKGAIFRFNPYNAELEAENRGIKYKLQISYDPECVIINDQQYGKSAALNAWYNQNSKAFLWFAQEGRELVLYQYNLP